MKMEKMEKESLTAQGSPENPAEEILRRNRS